MLFPGNISLYLSPEEITFSIGKLYMILTGQGGKGRKENLIAVTEWREACKIIAVINHIPEKERLTVKVVA